MTDTDDAPRYGHQTEQAAASEKLKPKSAVHYRDAKCCGSCEYMNADGSCEKVAGKVKPEMLCNLWEAKD